MKKGLLIALGVLLILIIIGVWFYLFKYGAPKNSEEVFAKFGFGNDEVLPVVPENTEKGPENTTGGETVPLKKLRQLTTRPVAGAVIVGNTISFVEQGTGHIYTIDLGNNAETITEGATIPLTTEALFSNDGSQVVITYYENSTKKMVVRGTKASDASKGIMLPEGAAEVAFTGTSTLSYIIKSDSGSLGYTYNTESSSSKLIFVAPLRDVRILWGNPVYLYTTPTSQQNGHLYIVRGDTLEYTTKSGPGLMGVRAKQSVIATTRDSENWFSYIVSTSSKDRLPVVLIPEKCTTIANKLFCAVPQEIKDERKFPDNWYKGTVALTDSLRLIDSSTWGSTVISNFLEESKREIDVLKIGTDTQGSRIWFINKNDNALWLYDTTL